jgi:hypothetical protein
MRKDTKRGMPPSLFRTNKRQAVDENNSFIRVYQYEEKIRMTKKALKHMVAACSEKFGDDLINAIKIYVKDGTIVEAPAAIQGWFTDCKKHFGEEVFTKAIKRLIEEREDYHPPSSRP